jgi:hypothetical protein
MGLSLRCSLQATSGGGAGWAAGDVGSLLAEGEGGSRGGWEAREVRRQRAGGRGWRITRGGGVGRSQRPWMRRTMEVLVEEENQFVWSVGIFFKAGQCGRCGRCEFGRPPGGTPKAHSQRLPARQMALEERQTTKLTACSNVCHSLGNLACQEEGDS